MSDRYFVDTNILMYAHDTARGVKHDRAKDGQVYAGVRVVNPLKSAK